MHEQFRRRVIEWYRHNARTLPWRGNVSSWAVMVSEFMLQQTPVVRVLPVFEAWMRRWPEPADLVAEPAGEAVREWGGLGYPRRALRLHAAAVTITREHQGQVPSQIHVLRALPGVGDYTAAAIASFAFGQDHVVLDVNVRRLFTRAIGGEAQARQSTTKAEWERASGLLPPEDAWAPAAEWAAATMELGALVCTSRNPACHSCPISDMCRWRLRGYPAAEGRGRRSQAWEGTDRQCRGRIMATLREAEEPVAKKHLDLVWPHENQYERCLDSLVADGLVEPVAEQGFALPGHCGL